MKKSEIQQLMNQLYEAFDHFNEALFGGFLEPCAISIGRKRGARGVYRPQEFAPKDIQEAIAKDSAKLDEILLNPESFDRDEKTVLSTLVHEMVHQWEQHHGHPGKNGYHNRSWANMMKVIGLHPSDTGEPGGREVGRRVSHYIIEGGDFDIVANEFIEQTSFSIEWIVLPKTRASKSPRKVTYRCECDQPFYANISGRKIRCLDCDTELLEDM